jgi:hypothetical protein
MFGFLLRDFGGAVLHDIRRFIVSSNPINKYAILKFFISTGV